MDGGSYWYRRIVSEFKKISPHIRFKHIKGGFVRIYFRQAYVGECPKWMNEFGHDIYERTTHFEDYSYYQEHHDVTDTSLRVKNFKEGYWETKRRLLTKLFMLRNNKEFYDTARKGYSQMRVR